MFHHAQKCNQAAAPFGFWCKFLLKFIIFLFKLAEWNHLFTAIGKLCMKNRLWVPAWAMVQFQAKTCVRGEKMKINYMNGWKLVTFFLCCQSLFFGCSSVIPFTDKARKAVSTRAHIHSCYVYMHRPVWTSLKQIALNIYHLGLHSSSDAAGEPSLTLAQAHSPPGLLPWITGL